MKRVGIVFRVNNTEANCLEGTKEHFDENHPLFGYRGTRRLLAVEWNFRLRGKCRYRSLSNNPNLSVIFPCVNDADQLKPKLLEYCVSMVLLEKVGTMIELPSAYFDLEAGYWNRISKIVVGMND